MTDSRTAPYAALAQALLGDGRYALANVLFNRNPQRVYA